MPTQPLHSSKSKGKRKHPKYNPLFGRPFCGCLQLNKSFIYFLWYHIATMNDKKQRYNTIQKPYNNKYHHTTITTRTTPYYFNMEEQHHISPYHITTNRNSTNERVVFTSGPFSVSDITFFSLSSI